MDAKRHMQRNALVISTLMALYPLAYANPGETELPTGANIVAGDIHIETSHTPDQSVMDINQATQRGVIDWQSFNVGANSVVNFNQPNASSSTLNRIVGANPSQIYGQINATGEVLLVNGQGIYFSPNSQIEVGSIAATTHDISNDDYLNGNYQFQERTDSGSIVNQGSIKALNDYAALLAPEVRNEGLIFARQGTVALASGETILLKFNDTRTLSSITATPSLIKGLIDNRYLIEAPGGQVIMTATAVNILNGGIIKQSGQVNVTQAVQQSLTQTSDGKILLSSNQIIFNSQSQTIAHSSQGNSHISATASEHIDVKAGAIISTNATATGQDAGNIQLTAGKALSLAGSLSANASNSGVGGQIKTSAPTVSVASSAQISATSNVPGQAGSWDLEASKVSIDPILAEVMGASLNHTNVNASANQTLCGANCDDVGAILLESNSAIHKISLIPTALSLRSDRNLTFNGSLQDDQGTLTASFTSFGDLSVSTLANLTSGQVSFVAAEDISIYGQVNSIGSNTQDSMVNILGANVAIYGLISGRNPLNGGKINLSALNDLMLGASSRVRGYGSLISMIASTINLTSSVIQTNNGNGRGGTIDALATANLLVNQSSLLANGTIGGNIRLMSADANVNLSNTLVQTNGSNGRGGTIEIAGYSHTALINTSIQSNGSDFGGKIYLGNNIHTQAIPFSQYTFINSDSFIQAIGSISGGVVETSGHILDLLTLINVGRGGIWIIDPYDVTIASSSPSGTSYSSNFTPNTSTVILASSIEASLNDGTDVSITTGSTSTNTLTVNAAINKSSGTDATLSLYGGTIDINSAISSSSGRLDLRLDGGTIDVSAPISLNDGNLTIFTSGTSTLGGVFSDGNLLKYGNGELILTEANAYTRTYVIAGTLSISSDANLGTLPAETTHNMIYIQGGRLKTTTDMTINSKRGIYLNNANAYIEVADDTTLTYDGIISGTNASYDLVLNNSGTTGTLVLGGTSTYVGSTKIYNGTLSISDELNLGPTTCNSYDCIDLYNAGVLQITDDVTFGSNQGIKIANSDNTKILIATGKTLTLNHEFYNQGGGSYVLTINDGSHAGKLHMTTSAVTQN
jgi:fibronectin-binding autotransporter adhesin